MIFMRASLSKNHGLSYLYLSHFHNTIVRELGGNCKQKKIFVWSLLTTRVHAKSLTMTHKLLIIKGL